jgi:hypothetical protein
MRFRSQSRQSETEWLKRLDLEQMRRHCETLNLCMTRRLQLEERWREAHTENRA